MIDEVASSVGGLPIHSLSLYVLSLVRLKYTMLFLETLSVVDDRGPYKCNFARHCCTPRLWSLCICAGRSPSELEGLL